MKILVAEDDNIARLVLESALRKLGHEPVAARDGNEAWSLFCAAPGRVIVSDWMMPGLDGLELCRRVRAHKTDYVYFILLTSLSANTENRHAAVEAGVDDFLSKPIDQQELWMRLRVAERILQFTTQVRELESFLPICGYCKKIRDDSNYWQQVESYFKQKQGTQFSHSVCPDCMERVIRPQLAALGLDLDQAKKVSPQK
ncbi:MAG: response regulator [Opitutae bacterium]|nr:response regulator [Opitutae bacterium]